MFNSSFSLIFFGIFPAIFIIRIAYLAGNDFYCSVIDYLNEKFSKIFLYATFACTLYTWYLVKTGRTDLTENILAAGIIYFLVLTAANLRVFDDFGIVFMLAGNVIVYAVLLRELFDGGLYPVFVFSALYCVYSLVFLNLHHIAKLFNLKFDKKA